MVGGWRKILNFGNGITEILVVQNSAQQWSASKEGAWKETNYSDQVVENEREKKKKILWQPSCRSDWGGRVGREKIRIVAHEL